MRTERKDDTGRRGSASRLGIIAVVLTALAATYLCIDFMVQPADGARASRPMRQYKIEGNTFSRYDFESREYSKDNVDWAVDLIFAHGATVDSVKYRLEHNKYESYWWGKERFLGEEVGASSAFMRVNGGFGPEWDQDAGKKTNPCQTDNQPSVEHYRVYGPPTRPVDHFLNQRWGAFVVAAAHIDHNECPFLPPEGSEKQYFHGNPTWFGKNEIPEYFIGLVSEGAFPGSKVSRAGINLGNREHWRAGDGNHVWWNDGRATFISVHPPK